MPSMGTPRLLADPDLHVVVVVGRRADLFPRDVFEPVRLSMLFWKGRMRGRKVAVYEKQR